MPGFRALVVALSCCAWLFGCERERAKEPLRVAVASNFAPVMTKVARRLETDRGIEIEIVSGSSGKLAAQIENGAPFDVFLSADAERPRQLEARGLTAKGTRFVYAVGRLAVCGRALAHPEDGIADLRDGHFDKLSIANPATAPYGVAAEELLRRLRIWEQVKDRLVRGENISQSYQFVESGAADLGIVARSLVADSKQRCFVVPADMHAPIVQEGVIVARAGDDARAQALVDDLRSDATRRLLTEAGYDAPAP